MRRRDLIAASVLTLPLPVARARAASAPVVLELFTSQGCSSCPPADALLGELASQPNVIGLAWHVDYWNSLGWRDPYARSEWTDRQKSYAARLNSGVYTPALVVNGVAMVVGSDKTAVRQAIDQAIPPPVVVTLRRTAAGLEAGIGTPPTRATGLLVIYDPRVATQVGAGENEGRQLVEYRVVRDVVALESLTSRLTLPSIAENRGAALLIQDAAWRVIGAADLRPGQDS
jgi:hypothetical protein